MSSVDFPYHNSIHQGMKEEELPRYPTDSPSTLNSDEYHRLRQLEGECVIEDWQCLQLNYPKAIFCCLLLTLSVVGLFLLKHFKKLRVALLYSSLQAEEVEEATHVYVQGTGHEEICQVKHLVWGDKPIHIVEFKHLEYQVLREKLVPLAFHYWDELEGCLSSQFLRSGLTAAECQRRAQLLGKNEHLVEVPGYFQFILETMTAPFFLFQYVMSAVFILESMAVFGVLLLVFSWLTTTINYALLRRSYQQIKATAEKQFPVSVLREGRFLTIDNTDLVPGDLYRLQQETPCDSILLQGDLFVDEASLTGENIPIPKFRLVATEHSEQSEHWIFEGSRIETAKEGSLALAIFTGYCSRRGRIIRKILTRKGTHPELFSKLIYFMIEVLLVVLLLYLITLGYLLSSNIETSMVVFRLLDFVSMACPPPYPIYFNLAYSFCLVRLHRSHILGTDCQQTVEGSRLKTLCFDKTGTLTRPEMVISGIFLAKEEGLQKVTEPPDLMRSAFACCHSVEQIEGRLRGDEIDLKVFLQSGGSIRPSHKAEAIRNIAVGEEMWQILKIHQYESKFQSMSVVAREASSREIYIFCKGSPELIHHCSSLHYNSFLPSLKSLSLQGYRTIAFGCSPISQEQLHQVLALDRAQVIKLTQISGVVAFANSLKEDARTTISTLTSACINTKIITGDNIFLGIQTALHTGMVPEGGRVCVLQGSHYDADTGRMEATLLSRGGEGQFREEQQTFSQFRLEDEENVFYAVDNDFVKKLGPDFLHHKIKVFARITPENKALIVRKHKELFQKEREASNWKDQLFGDCRFKVGMVGDGANDLIAIKEADVGIAIRASDAVYSASFAVRSLHQILELIREAKNTERQLIDIVQYYGICSMTNLTQTLILTADETYPTSLMLLYRSFCIYLIVTLFLGLSRPSETLTPFYPQTNFMGLQHHLVHWGTSLVVFLGLLGTYEYYVHSGDFEANPVPYVTFANGFNGVCKSASIVFLCANLVYTLLGPIIYRSKPWKEPSTRNRPFIATVGVNLVVSVLMFFLTSHLALIDLVQIGLKEAAVCLLLVLTTMAIAALYNWGIQQQAWHRREDPGFSPATQIFQEIKSNST